MGMIDRTVSDGRLRSRGEAGEVGYGTSEVWGYGEEIGGGLMYHHHSGKGDKGGIEIGGASGLVSPLSRSGSLSRRLHALVNQTVLQ